MAQHYILDQHEISDDDLEQSVDTLAKEYNKQDDATMKVSVAVLRRVYEALSEEGDNEYEKEHLDPDSHLYFINAFDMPAWHWSVERETFERQTNLTMAGSAESRIRAMRDRLNIIKQCVQRNEHFVPSTVPSKDREKLVTLRSTKQLLGRAGERFLLLGMLAHDKEGNVCLEDADGSVRLDFSTMDEPGEGLFAEGSFALVEGEYNEEDTLEVVAIGQPPCESREVSRSIYGHIDFLGKGATSILEDKTFKICVENELTDVHFFVLSDVWLDHPRTLSGIRQMLEFSIRKQFIPKVIVLCGNFTSRSITRGNARDIQNYQDNFDALGDVIASFPEIMRYTHFVLVPGPLDVTVNAILPRQPLLSSLVSRLKAKVPNVHFGTNPCRIKFFHQEIVVFREDVMARMLRNIIGLKSEVESLHLKRFSLLDQAHMSPLILSVQPVLTEYDHALRLYPLPTAVVLADKYDHYNMTYNGCHVFNPGSFVGGKSFFFSSYHPSATRSDAWWALRQNFCCAD
ncbi:DNA polymerase epsilon, subunit B [Fistulina hepatica ATCC 64428]|nr:DNA polymerase epsilon, subunit B [Fistulina hepatica ATCC 64428]